LISVSDAYSDLVDAVRMAQQLGVNGWISELDELALDRLLLSNESLGDAAVRRELGAVLANERFAEELIETLQAYFDSGESVTGAARLLHLATRTVGYRLQRVESVLGHALAGPGSRRLSTALLVHRLRSAQQSASDRARDDLQAGSL
jgi:DNA-binding PucR family transcriptional regulator